MSDFAKKQNVVGQRLNVVLPGRHNLRASSEVKWDDGYDMLRGILSDGAGAGCERTESEGKGKD
jgi:hypothetical protein